MAVCNIGADTCRHVAIMNMVERRSTTYTTRLTTNRPDRLNIGDLASISQASGGEIIKALFVLPPVDCRNKDIARPTLVFASPKNFRGFQHMIIAGALSVPGLLARENVPAHLADEHGNAWKTALGEGVYGVRLHSLRISTNNDTSSADYSTHVDVTGQGLVNLYINRLRDPGLVDPETKEVDLTKLGGIEENTARTLWADHIYGFLFRADMRTDKRLWVVVAHSGARGPLPKELVPVFLETLAFHVAPDYRVLQFVPDGDLFKKELIRPPWERVQEPSCLHWPDELRVVKPDEVPPPHWIPRERQPA